MLIGMHVHTTYLTNIQVKCSYKQCQVTNIMCRTGSINADVIGILQ